MAHIFISYSKKDIDFARQLKALLEKSSFVVWMDETELMPSELWWPAIEQSIETCAAFIVLMSPFSLQSIWVQREILHAERTEKKIFPILISGAYWSRLAEIQHENMTAGVPSALPIRMEKGLRGYIPADAPTNVPPPLPGALLPASDQALINDGAPISRRRFSLPMITGGIAAVAVIAILLAVAFNNNNGMPTPTLAPTTATTEIALVATGMPTHTDAPTILAETPTETPLPPTATVTNTARPTQTPTPLATDTPAPTLTASATISMDLLALTFDVEETRSYATTFAAQTASRAVLNARQTSTESAVQTATATQWTATPTPNQTLTFEAFLTQRAASTSTAARTQTMAAWTDTPTVTYTPTLTRTPTYTPTSTPVANNAAWEPVPQDFDGVTMVLVPAGCFMMGSDDSNTDERPVHEQCFTEPFWIDQTEVTQADFERLGGVKARANGFDGDQRPVELITWFEARDFCALRGGRLPTEAEWEYAARGPDGWVYPWGETWDDTKAIWSRNSSQGTADVGTIAAGASWVGALDMSGNVWEWVSSLYEAYPYDISDGRGDTANRTDGRVLRGGSWSNDSPTILRAAIRIRYIPDDYVNNRGVRCAFS